MKKLFLTTALLAFLFTSKGQEAPLSVGQTQLNLGLGLSGYGVPLYAGLDYGATPDITIGGELSLRAYQDSYQSHDYQRNIVGIDGNANYHFNSVLNIPNNFDFYAGLNLGYFIWSSPLQGYDDGHSSGIGLGAQIGTRYYFTDRLGVNLELQAGNVITLAKAGITIKF